MILRIIFKKFLKLFYVEKKDAYSVIEETASIIDCSIKKKGISRCNQESYLGVLETTGRVTAGASYNYLVTDGGVRSKNERKKSERPRATRG